MRTCTYDIMNVAPAYTDLIKLRSGGALAIGSKRALQQAKLFHVVISAAAEVAPPSLPNVVSIHVPLYDAPWNYKQQPSEFHEIKKIAAVVADYVKAGKSVLIVCQMGMNRSALVAGLTLLELGYEPHAAIALLSKRNPCVLSNDSFKQAIHYGWQFVN